MRSRRHGFKERVVKFFSPSIRFYRCHKCGARYMLKDGKCTTVRPPNRAQLAKSS